MVVTVWGRGCESGSPLLLSSSYSSYSVSESSIDRRHPRRDGLGGKVDGGISTDLLAVVLAVNHEHGVHVR